MRRLVTADKMQGRRVGVVMTMGALHEGHLSLVRRSVEECDRTAVTIFVNPTQFGPQEDYAKYPRQLHEDLSLLADLGVNYVFTPQPSEMYPSGHSTRISPPRVAEVLEGQCRPGHFEGVTTIVLKLLQVIPADIAYFGQKDYQQYLVIRTMVEELDVASDIRVCPIVRDADGLALSSRNQYLATEARQRALAISESLSLAEQMVRDGQRRASTIAAHMRQHLVDADIERIDYIALVDPKSLQEVR
ncbi:MAG: pantoate--beta-alanine ligase, partial [Planctomycetales bacterium]|nr:pantoate--beta-alanine ligase [Planctomycetales bacterium]